MNKAPMAITAYPQPTNPHHEPPPTPNNLTVALTNLSKSLETATKKAGSLAGNLYSHLRTAGPEGTLTRLAHGTRVLTEGGCDRLFRNLFPEILPSEKLISAYACYLSTTAGPVMGTLYISDRRVAFCSDQPMRMPSTAGGGDQYCYATGVAWCYYKVVVMVEDLVAVNASASRRNHMDKYLQVVTRNGYEFWFMGFIFYDKALKDLRKAMKNAVVFKI